MIGSAETEMGVRGRRKVDDIGTDEVQSDGRRANQTVMAQCVLLQQWTSQKSSCFLSSISFCDLQQLLQISPLG